MANHGETYPECTDYEETGTASHGFSNVTGGTANYVERAPGQTKFTITVDATVTGYCEIWAHDTYNQCVIANTIRNAELNSFTLRELTTPGTWTLRDGLPSGKYLSYTLSEPLGKGEHIMYSYMLASDTLCDLIGPGDDEYKELTAIYVDEIPPKELSCQNKETSFGNPCDTSNGNKYQVELDYDSPFKGLDIRRYYNSILRVDAYMGQDYGMGEAWTTDFLKRLIIGNNVIIA